MYQEFKYAILKSSEYTSSYIFDKSSEYTTVSKYVRVLNLSGFIMKTLHHIDA